MAANPEPIPTEQEAVPQLQPVPAVARVPHLQPAPASRPQAVQVVDAAGSDEEGVGGPSDPNMAGENSRKNSRRRNGSRARNRSRQRGGSNASSRPVNRNSGEDFSDVEGGDDNYYRDMRHPDRPARSTRPPRAYLNHPAYATADSPAKIQIEETKGGAQAREYYTYDSGGQELYSARPRNQQYYDEEFGYGPGPIMTPGYGRTGTALGRFSTDGGPPRINWHQLSREERAEVLRIPWTQWMNSEFKNHFVATIGETIGTTMFLFFAFAGTEVANTGMPAVDPPLNVGSQLYISLAFGFSLMVNVWIFFRISGAQFNPAVTLGMVLVRAIGPIRAMCLLIGQISGSLLASVMVRYLFPQPFAVRTSLAKGTSLPQGIFIEALLTAELVFTIFMLAKEKHKANYMAPIGIGLALFIAEMAGVPYTGGSLNPARSFGPCVVTGVFEPEHWVYWVGPSIGAVIAVVFYKFIKTLEYEMANPGADGDLENDPTKNPAKRAELMMNRKVSLRDPSQQ